MYYKAYYFRSTQELNLSKPFIVETNELGPRYANLAFLKRNCAKSLRTLEENYNNSFLKDSFLCVITETSLAGGVERKKYIGEMRGDTVHWSKM